MDKSVKDILLRKLLVSWIVLSPLLIFGQTPVSKSHSTVTAIDGNIYKTVKIGEQVWMAENLHVARYNNGDSIANVTKAKDWRGLSSGAWSYFNNDPQKGKTYGRLYNWYSVNDPRGLCPDG